MSTLERSTVIRTIVGAEGVTYFLSRSPCRYMFSYPFSHGGTVSCSPFAFHLAVINLDSLGISQ